MREWKAWALLDSKGNVVEIKIRENSPLSRGLRAAGYTAVPVTVTETPSE